MSEDIKENESKGIFSNLKNQIITGVGVILTGIGSMFMDEVKTFIGIDDNGNDDTEEVSVQKQSNNQSVIINVPEQKPAETKTIIKEVPVKKKKEKEEVIDW